MKMKRDELIKLIDGGEKINVEFKESRTNLNKDVFESVCAFLNRNGGHLFLGVQNDGNIRGVDTDFIDKIKKDFVTSLNNPQVISPTFYLNLEEIEISKRIILYIYVPESSQVHRCKGKIFDRNEDGDFDITDNTNLVSGLYLRKQSSYTENKIFPFAKLEDLEAELFSKVRRMVANQKVNHPWLAMENLELLKSAGLYLKDLSTGQEGLTLGCILLLGKEEAIHSVLPHHRTDAILRRENIDRYDDRDDIRINLIGSYERLMHFIAKHLNDKFYLEGDQRISIRDKIFREAVSNLLIHREYSQSFPAKIIIEKNIVNIENSNKPHGHGPINPDNFSPYPKNPTLAKFFKEIGLVDELGSGVRNMYKYTRIYSGAEPVFIEEDVFKTLIPLNPQATPQANPQANPQARLLDYCHIPRSRQEIQDFVGIKDREYFRKNILNPLINEGLLELSLPDKPTSPKQKYLSKTGYSQ